MATMDLATTGQAQYRIEKTLRRKFAVRQLVSWAPRNLIFFETKTNHKDINLPQASSIHILLWEHFLRLKDYPLYRH